MSLKLLGERTQATRQYGIVWGPSIDQLERSLLYVQRGGRQEGVTFEVEPFGCGTGARSTRMIRATVLDIGDEAGRARLRLRIINTEGASREGDATYDSVKRIGSIMI